jgi:ABC-type phosphate transport system substrate-binding protein
MKHPALAARKLFTLALLALATCAILPAFAAAAQASADSPSADATVACAGGPISGSGSALASVAIDAWATAYNETCATSQASVSYDATRSERSILQSWNFFGNVPAISPSRPQFIGVNGTITSAQFANAESVLKGGRLVAIPVAQTAIAVVANPPAGCTVDQINNPQLKRLWEEKVTKWSELTEATGECNAPIKRVVPRAASQVTTQFKAYMELVHYRSEGSFGCTSAGNSLHSWQELEPEESNFKGPNLAWPVICNRPSNNLVRSEGVEEGSSPDHSGEAVTPAVPLTVEATPGSIGFATLPDAEAAGSQIVELANNGPYTESAIYASPAVDGQANCDIDRPAYGRYYVPPEGRYSGSGLNVEWFGRFQGGRGAAPHVGATYYPLCMTTFIVTAHGFSHASWENPYKKFLTTNEFIREYVLHEGQEVLETPGLYMAPVATLNNVSGEVLGAARWAASKISYEG